jgi:hypothetical protein
MRRPARSVTSAVSVRSTQCIFRPRALPHPQADLAGLPLAPLSHALLPVNSPLPGAAPQTTRRLGPRYIHSQPTYGTRTHKGRRKPAKAPNHASFARRQVACHCHKNTVCRRPVHMQAHHQRLQITSQLPFVCPCHSPYVFPGVVCHNRIVPVGTKQQITSVRRGHQLRLRRICSPSSAKHGRVKKHSRSTSSVLR